jgi:hypothetical protein
MTLADYMSPERFPLTTQQGLEPKDQMLIDAFNYDDLAESVEFGQPLTDEQLRRWAELKEKLEGRGPVIAEMKAMQANPRM